MANIETKALVKQTTSIFIQEPSLRNTLSSFYDEIAPGTKLDKAGTAFVGILTFGISGILSWFTVDFVGKFGISSEKFAIVYLIIHCTTFLVGSLGKIGVSIARACVLPNSKAELINKYITRELESSTPCEITVGTALSFNK